MSRRRIVLSAAAAAAVLGLGVLGQVATPAPATAATGSGTALDEVGACVEAGGRADVLIVMDTSGSLRSTDPADVRVDAAQYLVNELAVFADDSGAAVDVAVAGFDTGFRLDSGWVSVAGNADAVNDSLERYRTADTGLDTDYWEAVSGARSALAAKAAESSDRSSCPVWFWFSDGEYDIEPRSAGQLDRTGGPKRYAPDNSLSTRSLADQAVAAGTADLCRAGGQADQTRSAGITTIAIGLEHDQSDFTLMQRVAAGEGEACGEVPARGQFLPAGEVGDLFFAFDQFATPGRRPLENEGQVCGREQCAAGTHSFVVDSSISAARVLAGSDVDGATLRLVAPSGQSVDILPGEDDGSATVGGGSVRWQWLSPSTAQVVATPSGEGWAGQWNLVFLDPDADRPHGTSRTSVHLIADLKAAWTNKPEVLHQGDTEISLALVHRDDSPLDAGSVDSTLSLSAVLVAVDGSTVDVASDLAASSIEGVHRSDLSDVPLGPATLRLTLRVTTAEATTADGSTVAGTELSPIVTSYDVTVAPPPNYPTVPDTIDFGELEGARPVTVEVPVSGDGCVWLGEAPAATTLPDGVTAELGSPARSQADCATGSLDVTITPSEAGNGLVSGTTEVMAAPADDDGDPVAIPVQYRLEMIKPVNQPLRIALFLGVLLTGLLLPVAALYGLKAATARLHGSRVFAGVVRGRVAENGSFLDAAAVPHLNDLEAAYITGGRRELTVPGARLRTVVGLALTEPGYVRAELAGPSASSSTPPTVRGVARLPLDVRNHWLVGLDPHDPRGGPVEVIYLVSDEAQLPAVVADARRRVPDQVRRLREALPAEPAGGQPIAAGPSDGWSESGQLPRPDGDWGSAQAGAGDGWGSSGGGWGSSGGLPPAPPATPPPAHPPRATPQPPNPRPPGPDDGW